MFCVHVRIAIALLCQLQCICFPLFCMSMLVGFGTPKLQNRRTINVRIHDRRETERDSKQDQYDKHAGLTLCIGVIFFYNNSHMIACMFGKVFREQCLYENCPKRKVSAYYCNIQSNSGNRLILTNNRIISATHPPFYVHFRHIYCRFNASNTFWFSSCLFWLIMACRGFH